MFDSVNSREEFVRRIVRCLIELRAVRSLLGNCKVSENVESCKEYVSRSVRCLIELRVVRSLLEELQDV